MSPVADSNITPDGKLELITPGVFACSLVRTLDEKKMLVLGAVMGASKCLLPRLWPVVMLLELVAVLVTAAIARKGLKYCWERWKFCLPEHVDRINNLEMIWRAYLQNKPEFMLQATPSSTGYGISIVLRKPWVMNAAEYISSNRPRRPRPFSPSQRHAMPSSPEAKTSLPSRDAFEGAFSFLFFLRAGILRLLTMRNPHLGGHVLSLQVQTLLPQVRVVPGHRKRLG